MVDEIYLNSDTTIIWSDFVNASSGTPITEATIDGIVQSLAGSSLTTFTMSYDSDLAAYTGIVSPSTLLVLGSEYYILLTASYAGTTSVKRQRVIVAYDNFN